MSRHQAYRNYDYRNDLAEYDGEDDDEEMSPEDREQMSQATAAVRDVLGDSARMVTEAQIQESLWYYYFDVDKTVVYLTKKFITAPAKDPATSPKQKQAPAPASNKKRAKRTPPIKSTVPSSPAYSVSSLASDISNFSIDSTPLAKSKNINVLREYANEVRRKRHVNFVVVGHVDSGKSTMMARLLVDMNVVDQRTVIKYEQEAQAIGKGSFALAWVLDQSEDERTHGVTIDTAMRHFETPRTAFTILDAPGHQDFVPSMIAGASMADIAILVVDARTGAFESGLRGQTREHALLLRSMGVLRLVVAVNKMDAVDWSRERYGEIVSVVQRFLAEAQFKLANVSFVPVSGLLGDNLVYPPMDMDVAAALSWYNGDTLLDELERSDPLPRNLEKPLRLQVSEVFRAAGSAISAAGRVECGTLQVGDALLVVPGNVTAHIKALECNGKPVDWAVAGHNVVVHLCNVNALHVYAGVMLCDAAKPARSVESFTMKTLAFESLVPMPVELHRGRLNEAGVIQELMQGLDKYTGEVVDKNPVVVRRGRVARIRVRLGGKKMSLEAGQRVILRAAGKTVAAGVVE